MDRTKFYGAVRTSLFGGKLSQSNVDGMTVILDEFEAQQIPLDHAAYMLATAFHETASHMQPVMETRRPSEEANPSVDQAIARLESSWKAGKLPWVKSAYWRKNAKGRSYLGRGLPQLTHEANYRKIGDLLGVDLVNSPDLALDPSIAVKIMILGMTKGVFTGKDMGDYLDGIDEGDAEDLREYTNARYVVNGKDRAADIGRIAIKMETALKSAGY